MKNNLVLLIYSHPLVSNAPTIMEHVKAFSKYSTFSILELNVEYGFPKKLGTIEFSAIVLHYSLFGSLPYSITDDLKKYISASKAKKIYFFQDEMQYVQERFALVNNLGVDAIFTLLDPDNFKKVYFRNTSVKIVQQTLTGYVCDTLIQKSSKYFIPFKSRMIDVGYRARNLSYHYGRGAREKAEIADRFVQITKNSGLKLDISTKGQDRIYGDKWYKFMANCRFMIGTMGGVSIFDMTGEIKRKTDDFLKSHPGAEFDTVEHSVLAAFEKNINYRQVSPRVFECAAFRVCMIHYRDNYQGLMTAGKHYIALEKDFSNIAMVLQQIKDHALISKIIQNAYQDLINSGNFHYKVFMKGFDRTLQDLGCNPMTSSEEQLQVYLLINKDAWFRNLLAWICSLRSRAFPGRELLKKIAIQLGLKNKRKKTLSRQSLENKI